MIYLLSYDHSPVCMLALRENLKCRFENCDT